MAERMTERPIRFSAPMVRAILDGPKTQTRQVLKGANHGPGMMFDGIKNGHATFSHQYGGLFCWVKMPWSIGDTLWVREAFRIHEGGTIRDSGGGVMDYVEPKVEFRTDSQNPHGKWRPSIHMPRWASRITLRVTDVRVQRLQDISEDDAKAEGVKLVEVVRNLRVWHASYRAAFASLWNTIHGPGSWEANPWVAAITFERAKP